MRGKYKKKRTARTEYFLPIEPTIKAAEGDGPPKFEMTAYNADSALPVRGFNAPVVIELRSASFEKESTKINRNHQQDRELGHATMQRIDATGIYFAGVLSVPGPDRDQVVEAAKNNFPWDASIEASFPKPEFVPKHKSVVVNGHRFSGVYVARSAVLTGVAILNRGADRQTSVSIAAKLNKENVMSEDLRSFIEASGFNPDEVAENETQMESLEAAFEASKEVKTPRKKPNDIANWSAEAKMQRELQAEEAERVRDIRRVCAQYNEPEIENPNGDGTKVSLAAHAILNNLSSREVLLEAKMYDLDVKSQGYSSPAIHKATDADAAVIECSMLQAANVSPEMMEQKRWYSQETIDKSQSADNRGFKVSRLAYQTMQAAGVYHPLNQLNDGYIEAAVKAHHKLQASGFTTLSLPGILSNVMNKTLLAAYMRSPSFIPFCFGVTSASDFKPTYSYQLEGSGMLEKMGQDGEIKHGKLVESQYTKQLETYSKMLSFTRKMMINDDLSALTRVATILGQMAFKAREYAATQTIANSTMFSVPNGNLLTANPLSIDGLTASGVSFDAQTDDDGLPISIDGGRVLAPTSLKVITSQLVNQTEIRDTTANEKNFINNPHAGTFEAFNTQWLDNSIATAAAGVPDANRSSTWYRFADPMNAPAFEVVYLNGQDSPTINSAETDFNTLGMQWRCYFDFSFGEANPKMAQKNVGV